MYNDTTAYRGFLSANENYILTHAQQIFFGISNVSSGLAPCPWAQPNRYPLRLLATLAVHPSLPEAYVTHFFNQVTSIQTEPSFASNFTINTSASSVEQIAVDPSGSRVYIGEKLSGQPNQIFSYDLPNLTPSAGMPLVINGNVNDLALSYPNGLYALVADCVQNSFSQVEIATQTPQTIAVPDCPKPFGAL